MRVDRRAGVGDVPPTAAVADRMPTAPPQPDPNADTVETTAAAVAAAGDLPPRPLLRPAGRAVRVHAALGRAAAVVVAAVAVLALVGWYADIEVLETFGHRARIPMNPASALALLLASASLLLLTADPVGTRRRWLASGLAWAVMGIGFLKLAGYAGVPLRGDRLLFGDRVSSGRAMAPNEAAAFLLTAAGLLLVDVRVGPRSHPTPWLALSALAVALLALLGYAYDVAPLYQPGLYVAMALNTAACLLALALGVVAARPAHPPLATLLSDTVGGLIARRLLPAAVLMPAVGGYFALVVVRRSELGAELAVLLFTLSTIVVFVALTAWTAGRLHRLDLENRRTLDRLQRAEAVYHSLVQTLPQNIFRKTTEGRFTFGNRHFCQTLGRPLPDIVGRTDFDFYGPELAARYRHDDLDVARTGRTMDVVEEHVTLGGDRLYVQVIKTPVRGIDGQVIGVQGIFWDVTDRVVAQKELEEKNKMLSLANDELGRANDELADANQRLADANARLERAVAAERAAVAAERAAAEALARTQTHLVQSEKMVGLGQMVAGVAHEINNPLAFVTNNVAVLQRDVRALGGLIDLYRRADPDLAAARPDLAGEIAEMAEAIDVDYTRQNLDDLLGRSREGLRRIQQIVRDLRDFVRLDESDLQEVDLNVGVESTLNIILGHAKKKQLRVETHLAPGLPPVTCYPAKVNQVIMNLLSNAIDASHENGRVTVRTGTAGGEAGADGAAGGPPTSVVLEVTDEGCGIDPDVRRRIFDPFFTTKPVGQGTGLGLSISYGIVRDHGGTIEVDSEPGKGSTFRVTLPLAGPAKQEALRVERLGVVRAE